MRIIFIGKKALLVDNRSDYCFTVTEELTLSGKSKQKAMNQYKYLLHKKYGFHYNIRDICIRECTDNDYQVKTKRVQTIEDPVEII